MPAAWVEAATARQTSNGSNPKSDWDQGYGYQFWRCRHGAYRGDGAFGQYCIVLPEQDAVIAITAGVRDMQAVLNLVWDKLLPALKPSPLARRRRRPQAKLASTLKGLSLRLPEGKGTPPKVAGKKYVFPANDRKLESITLETGKDGAVTLVTRVDGAERRIACGQGAWQKGRAAWGRLPEQPAAASGAWTADDTFTAKVCFTETPFVVTVRLKFSGDEVRCESEANVGFGPTKDAAARGEGGVTGGDAIRASRDQLVGHERDPPAVGGPARDVDRPLAAEEPAEHVDLLGRPSVIRRRVTSLFSGWPFTSFSYERNTIGRPSGEGCGNQLLNSSSVTCSCSLPSAFIRQICIGPVRSELK